MQTSQNFRFLAPEIWPKMKILALLNHFKPKRRYIFKLKIKHFFSFFAYIYFENENDKNINGVNINVLNQHYVGFKSVVYHSPTPGISWIIISKYEINTFYAIRGENGLVTK